MISFTEYLLVEGDKGTLKALADDIVDQFAEERRWVTDEMLRVARKRLEEMPDFKNQPRKIETALVAIEHYMDAR